jgi:alpha-mannosidase
MVTRPQISQFQSVEGSDTVVENARYRLEFDPDTGYIKSLRDKTTDAELFIADAAVPVVIDDPSDTWSHNVFTFNHVAGKFVARSVKMVEQGPVKSVIRVISNYNHSSLIQDFAMFADRDEIEVSVTVDWHEEQKMLKLRFPMNIIQMKATYEIPYGHIERTASGAEEPGQSWIDLSGISRDSGYRCGLSILNDAKYSYDVHIRDIGLTVLRSPIYAHHMPLVPETDKLYTYMDQGVQKFKYTLLPHSSTWDEAGTVRKAAELNQRPVVLVTTLHEGDLPRSASFLSVDQENLLVSVLKKAEDNDDLIVRVYETAGVATSGTILLEAWNRTIEADFGPCEIKTFRVPSDASKPVVETNLLEWVE